MERASRWIGGQTATNARLFFCREKRETLNSRYDHGHYDPWYQGADKDNSICIYGPKDKWTAGSPALESPYCGHSGSRIAHGVPRQQPLVAPRPPGKTRGAASPVEPRPGICCVRPKPLPPLRGGLCCLTPTAPRRDGRQLIQSRPITLQEPLMSIRASRVRRCVQYEI